MPYEKLKRLSNEFGEGFDKELKIIKDLSQNLKDPPTETLQWIEPVLELKESLSFTPPYIYNKTTGGFNIFTYLTSIEPIDRKHIMNVLQACSIIVNDSTKHCVKELIACSFDEQSTPYSIKNNQKNYTVIKHFNGEWFSFMNKTFDSHFNRYEVSEFAPIKNKYLKLIDITSSDSKKLNIILAIVLLIIFGLGGILLSFLGAVIGYFIAIPIKKYIKKKITELCLQCKKEEDEIISIYLQEKEQYVEKKINELYPNNNLDQTKKLIPEIVKYVNSILYDYEQFVENCGIPPTLRYNHEALKILKSYFENMRVDTMKEAINLFFQEQRENQFYSSVNQAIDQAATQAQQAAKERKRLITDILDKQKEWNTLAQERNKSLNNIKEGVDDLKRKLDN